jgi:hypothetical protein
MVEPLLQVPWTNASRSLQPSSSGYHSNRFVGYRHVGICGKLKSSSGAGHVGGEDVVGVAVEVLAGTVVAHGGAGVGVAGGDLDVAEVDAGVEHGGDVGVSEQVWV